MKINKYRLVKAWECYLNNRKNGTNIYWSIRLAAWYFHAGFKFKGDTA